MTPPSLESLAESIREHGILQPLVLTSDPGNDNYTLIAGERRLRAAQLAGLSFVPVIVRQVERAGAPGTGPGRKHPARRPEPAGDWPRPTTACRTNLACRMRTSPPGWAKAAPPITNTLRLLNLRDEVKQALRDGKISEGHARALLGLSHPQAQPAALETVLKLEMSVRQTEELVRMLNGERPDPPRQSRAARRDFRHRRPPARLSGHPGGLAPREKRRLADHLLLF